jgi:protein gp37
VVCVAEHTGIEWCDATFNPWWGCERVSPGCAHCYADTLSKRYAGGKQLWGDGHVFRFFGDKHWAEPLKWARTLPAKLGRRPRVFCASMADVFEERNELNEHRDRLFELISATPDLDWLVLTKRPEFARDWLREWWGMSGDYGWSARVGIDFNVPANLWMGVSIENARFTWRADVLREIPAAVRFISAEPLLGSLFNDPKPRVVHGPDLGLGETRLGLVGRQPLDLTGIDWVIVGGESGPKARPFHLEHAREIIEASWPEGASIRDRLPVFVKQLGAKPIEDRQRYAAQIAIPIECEHGYDVCPSCDAGEIELPLLNRKGGDWDEWPADLRIREFPASAAVLA